MTAEDRLWQAVAVGVDSNILIYLVEGAAPQGALVLRLWRGLIEREIPLVVSEVAVGECLIGAYRGGQPAIIEAYRRLFSEPDEVTLQPLDLALLSEAARLGARQRLKLLDAVHLQTAAASGCDVFLTNDAAFQSIAGVVVLHLSALAI